MTTSGRRLSARKPCTPRGALFLGVAALLAVAGCTVSQNARRTTIGEPIQFSWKGDRGRSLRTYAAWADEAWVKFVGGCANAAYSEDFAAGFRDGFIDFVYAGGTGEPPPVPPRRFWNVDLRGGDGKTRANEWFAGYRLGASIARDGGYRDQATLSSSFRFGSVLDGFNAGAITAPTLGPGEVLDAPLLPGPLEGLPTPGDLDAPSANSTPRADDDADEDAAAATPELQTDSPDAGDLERLPPHGLPQTKTPNERVPEAPEATPDDGATPPNEGERPADDPSAQELFDEVGGARRSLLRRDAESPANPAWIGPGLGEPWAAPLASSIELTIIGENEPSRTADATPTSLTHAGRPSSLPPAPGSARLGAKRLDARRDGSPAQEPRTSPNPFSSFRR